VFGWLDHATDTLIEWLLDQLALYWEASLVS
jgi:hypothetical protein